MMPNNLTFREAGTRISEIPVSLSYAIIRLFSEGLYKSPHKAVEELVSNSYDAGAKRVHILLPDQSDADAPDTPLWVIDDGHGMEDQGFHKLWRVADSDKAQASATNGRPPIGQFGIGKLAAYVLAWRLIHVSRVANRYLLTEMDFRAVRGRRADHPDPISVLLRELDESMARELLSDVRRRSSEAWNLMFGSGNSDSSWTVAGLTDFKDFYHRLSAGTLRWVLSTGMPLHSDFQIYLENEPIPSSKARLNPVKELEIDSSLEGIGAVMGVARIYEKPLTQGKSAEVGRSHGFFIRVRGRVINLEDELFGINQPDHAAWTRFALEVRAEGLRDHLLSSREGVRDSQDIHTFREFLADIFNRCRSAFDRWNQTEDLEIRALLSDIPSHQILDPLLSAVHTSLESGESSFYIDAPRNGSDLEDPQWREGVRSQIAVKPFEGPRFVKHGPHAAALRYDPITQSLAINLEHPFVSRLTGDGKNRNPAKIFALSEVLIEGLLQDLGIRPDAIAAFLRHRDRTLRLTAGEAPPSLEEAFRLLRAASDSPDALERATGAAFRVLGFEYERKGGNRHGADGVLFARLGRRPAQANGDLTLVYDARHTAHPSVPADRIDPSRLERCRVEESAQFGFFIAAQYAAEGDPDGNINRRMSSRSDPGPFRHLTLLKIEHLSRLVGLHLNYGLTLLDIRSLFEQCRTVAEVDAWISGNRHELAARPVPTALLLQALEDLNEDVKAVPHVMVARRLNSELMDFLPERLIARMQAVEKIIGERWLHVEESGRVTLHQTATQIRDELNRRVGVLELEDMEL
ncbi:MAG: ATP-binding protein [Bacteroidota bacterium]|nr:ATP-binding protein [Bacteroidota bacterium]